MAVKKRRKAKPKQTKKRKKGKPTKVKRPKLPKGQGEGWKRRTHSRGFNARQILKKTKSKSKVIKVKTAIQLAQDGDIDQTSFNNLILSLGYDMREAYTFWFSPP